MLGGGVQPTGPPPLKIYKKKPFLRDVEKCNLNLLFPLKVDLLIFSLVEEDRKSTVLILNVENNYSQNFKTRFTQC